MVIHLSKLAQLLIIVRIIVIIGILIVVKVVGQAS